MEKLIMSPSLGYEEQLHYVSVDALSIVLQRKCTNDNVEIAERQK